LLGDEIGSAFSNADLTIITDVYSAGEKPIPGIDGKIIYDAAKAAGCNVKYIPSLKEIEDYILQNLIEKDMVITMGAGDIYTVGISIAKKIMESIPQP
jgi:UDP-N-acetylmuramate--alanine ligase